MPFKPISLLRVSSALAANGVPSCRASRPTSASLLPWRLPSCDPRRAPFLFGTFCNADWSCRCSPPAIAAYKVIYRFHNRPRWYHIGAADAIALADARRLAAEVMLEVIRGKDPAAERRVVRGDIFAELANRYLEEHAKKKNKSWQQAAKLVRRYLLPTWGDLSANTITRSDVRALIGKINGPVQANQVCVARRYCCYRLGYEAWQERD